MPDETRESHAEDSRTMPAWGEPPDDANRDSAGRDGSWLAVGIGLLLWTGLALLVTAA